MNAITAREVVALIRELRDGTITEERLERWLAELLIGCIPREEPNVAKARIVRLRVEAHRRNHYPMRRADTETAHELALALACIAHGPSLLLGPTRPVA
jgi:hypothetical protein